MRDISWVLRQLIDEVGDNSPELTTKLKSLQSSVLFAAPELNSALWGRLGEIVNSSFDLQSLTVEWKLKFISAYMDESVDAIRKKFNVPEVD